MPTYTRPHYLLRWGGSAAQGQETWSCSVRLAPNGDLSPDEMLTLATNSLEAISEAVQAWHVSPAADVNPICLLDRVDLNPIGTDGRYLFPNDPQQWDYPGDGFSGGGELNGPLQLAYCVTMRAMDYRRGPAAFGRFYVPCGSLQVTGTGVISSPLAQGYADAAGTLLEAVQVVGADPSDVLRLRLFGDGVGGPRESRVRSVEVGNVLDTQRRRRRQIGETYSVASTWTEPE